MNSRERVLTALKHEQPDRIPLDLGSSNVTGIVKNAYLNLMNYLGKDVKEVQFFDTWRSPSSVYPISCVCSMCAHFRPERVRFIGRAGRK